MLSLLILFFCISIVFSFLCSMWEAVLLSITPTFASIKMQEGSAVGRMIKHFKDNIDQPLAAILTLNTIAHTVGAIGVGAQATKIWAQSHPWITGFAVPAVMTLAILILSEIIPKTIGANYWKELSPFTVHSLRVIIVVLYPLVRMSQLITGMLKKDRSMSVFTRTEFAAMAEIGAQEGVFDRDESEIINNLLRFHKVLARDIMTPRTVVKAVSEEMTLAEFHAANPNLRFSRIPVYPEQLEGPDHRLRTQGRGSGAADRGRRRRLADPRDQEGDRCRQRRLSRFPTSSHISSENGSTSPWWSTSSAARPESSPWRTSSRPCSDSRSSTRWTVRTTCKCSPGRTGSVVHGRSGSSKRRRSIPGGEQICSIRIRMNV